MPTQRCPSPRSRLYLFLLLVRDSALGVPARSAVVHSQQPPIDLLPIQRLIRALCAGDIDEVCVCESSRLAGPAINCHSDVDYIPDIFEEVVQVAVRHLKRHVSDEESLGGWVLGVTGRHVGPGFCQRRHVLLCELNCDATSFVELTVHAVSGSHGGINRVVLDVTIAGESQQGLDIGIIFTARHRHIPFAQTPGI